MKKIKLITVTAMLFICINSCDSWPTDLAAYVDQESKDYCLFGTGSYWIYQDSATLETDSAIIYNVSYEKTNNGDRQVPYAWEEYTMYFSYFFYDNTVYKINRKLSSARISLKNVENGIIKPIYVKSSSGLFLPLDKYSVHTYANYHNGDIAEFLCPTIGGGACITCEIFYPHYQIGNKTFYNVKVFSYPIDSTQTTYQSRVYWAKHIGLIRLEAVLEGSPVVYNLVKYNINPYKN
jgi:hypothetical protein